MGRGQVWTRLSVCPIRARPRSRVTSRSMGKRCGTLLSALSLLFSLAFAGLCVRSFMRIDHGSFCAGRCRYTLKSERGRLGIFSSDRQPDEGQAWDLLASLNNRSIRWDKSRSYRYPSHEPIDDLSVRIDKGSVAASLLKLGASAQRPLLWALEDPEKFAAAHVLLSKRVQPRQQPAETPRGSGRFVYNGLSVRPRQPDYDYGLDAPEIDPAQAVLLCRHWHQLLDIRLMSFPYFLPFGACLFLPAISLGKWARRRRRGRLGCCVRCGYDLRGASARCPECGNDRMVV